MLMKKKLVEIVRNSIESLFSTKLNMLIRIFFGHLTKVTMYVCIIFSKYHNSQAVAENVKIREKCLIHFLLFFFPSIRDF